MSDEPLLYLRDIAAQHGCGDIASIVLDDPRFPVWSGSSGPHQHHYGDGGLARHTAEVVRLCLANIETLKLSTTAPSWGVPSGREAFLAALFHDYGKIWDYEFWPAHTDTTGHHHPDEWRSTPHKRLVHHISRSAIEWSRAVDRFPAYRDIEEPVLHAILAHHGLREWGSPVAPKTRLAWLLHLCDGLSARFDDADSLDIVAHKKAIGA